MKICRHAVEFYGAHEDRIARNVARYLADSLRSGGAAIAVASARRREAILEELERSQALTLAACGDRLVLLDDEETLETFMRDGHPNAERVELVLGGLISRLASQYGRLHVYGEMVGRLWTRRAFAAASELEQIWNQLLKRTDFSLYCGYPIDVLSEDFQIPTVRGVLAAHGRLVPTLGDGFIAAIRRAMNELLGDDPCGIGTVKSTTFATMKTLLPSAEGMILRLRSALPRYAEDILTKAKEYA
ncbi:MAG: MEDS domain-containing protein [Candidatus Cybelea sp.]